MDSSRRWQPCPERIREQRRRRAGSRVYSRWRRRAVFEPWASRNPPDIAMPHQQPPPGLEPEPPLDAWSRFSVISQRLSNLSGPQFEQLSYAILQRRGLDDDDTATPRLIPGGLTYTRALTARRGPVDMMLVTPGRQLVLGGCGVIPPSDRASWKSKFRDDFIKIRAAAAAAGLSNVKFVFMTTADLQPEEIASMELTLSDDPVVTGVEINALRALAHDLAITNVDLAFHFLGVPIPVKRLIPLTPGAGSDVHRLPLPRRQDFESELVVLPADIERRITSTLDEYGHCVLYGPPASGKSWTAAAYAHSSPGHPAYYVDAARAADGDGRHWFQELVIANESQPIVVVDNCQAAVDEVEDLCESIELSDRLAARCRVVLVATLTKPQDARAGILRSWVHKWGIELSPRTTWLPIVRAFARHLEQLAPGCYGDIEEDVRENLALLEARHGHDLAASRARLESWQERQGSLAALPDDAFYRYLDSRYIRAAPTLSGVMMALWSHEVPVHQRFLDSSALLRQEADALRQTGMAVEDFSRFYGHSVRPTVHRSLAAELFRAWLRRDSPLTAESPSHVETRLADAYRSYLLTRPVNAQRLLAALHSAGQHVVVSRLLQDLDVYNAFLRGVEDASPVDYLLFMTTAQRHVPLRVSVLTDALRHADAQKLLANRLLETPMASVGLAHLRRIDPGLAKAILGNVRPELLIGRIHAGSAHTALNWLNGLQRDGYPETWLSQVLAALDPTVIGARTYHGGLQPLCWLARLLDGSTPRKGPGQMLFRSVGGDRLAAAFRRAPTLNTLTFFLSRSARDVRQLMLDKLTVDELASLLDAADLKELANAMHWYPVLGRAYERLKSTGALQKKLLDSTAAELGVFLHVCREPHNSPAVALDAARLIVRCGAFERFLEEDLSALALLLHHLLQIDFDSAMGVANGLGESAGWRRAVERSTLNGLQLLVLNLSKLRDLDGLPSAAESGVAAALAAADLSDATHVASVKTLSFFVWNAFAHLRSPIAIREAFSLIERLRSEANALPLEDLSLALWTAAKVVPDPGVVDESLVEAVRLRATQAPESELVPALSAIGAIEAITPGRTSGWRLRECDLETAAALVRSSRVEGRGVPLALVLVALEHGRGGLRVPDVLPADVTSTRALLETELGRAMSPIVVGVLERALAALPAR
jgi:hypothetical protein